MIHIEKKNVEEKDFLDLLENTKKALLVSLKNSDMPKPDEFETLVCAKMNQAAMKTEFEGKIKQTGKYDFPDIIANGYFGVEVKMTISDQRTSIGNSILESSRIPDIGKIYILFGKFGGGVDIKYRLYQECLPDVSVTHLPRYKIDMELAAGKSIFDKIGVEYDILRRDPIQAIKNYYRGLLKEGEELWWIGEGEGKTTGPIIKQFNNFSDEMKDNFRTETMILFPEIFGNDNSKFERPAAYLMARRNAVCPSFRDIFTAGGRIELVLKGRKISLPQIAGHLHRLASDIQFAIYHTSSEDLAYYWKSYETGSDPLNQWKRMIDKEFGLVETIAKASDVFDAGL